MPRLKTFFKNWLLLLVAALLYASCQGPEQALVPPTLPIQQSLRPLSQLPVAGAGLQRPGGRSYYTFVLQSFDPAGASGTILPGVGGTVFTKPLCYEPFVHFAKVYAKSLHYYHHQSISGNYV